MTREDAFEIWLPIIKMGVKSMPECSEAIDMAIEALEQAPCEDCISRKAAIDAIWDGVNMDIYTREVKECLEALPSITPVEKVSSSENPNRWIGTEVLDKIRAEIIKYEGDCRLSVDEYPSCKQCTDNTFETIYAILDKYKAKIVGGTQHDD